MPDRSKIMKKIFNTIGTLIRSFPHFVMFELLYKLFLLAVGTPVIAWLLKFTMNVAGIKYLTDESLLVYLKHPVTILLVLFTLFFLGIFTFVELSALAACFGAYARKGKLSAIGMFRSGIHSFITAFRGMGIVKFLVFMAFMPLAQFTLASGQFVAPLMPILRTIFKSLSSQAALIVYILIQILFVMVIVNSCYSMHFLALTNTRFSECPKKSKEIVKGNKLKMAVSLFGLSIFVMAALAVLTFGIGFLVVCIIKGFKETGTAFRNALKISKYAFRVFFAVSSFISAPVIMCWLTTNFISETEGREELIMPQRVKMRPVFRTAIMFCVIGASLFMNMSYLKALYQGNVSLQVGILTPTQVTAHRGFSYKAPENTQPAFEKAIKVKADYIELDVQLTSDGELVVFHDDTLDRTTDGTGKLSDHTYEELQQLSAGSWFSDDGKYDDVRIMKLSEVFELIDNDIMLNIEIKKHGDPEATAEKVVELVHEYDFTRSCYVTSFSYKALRRVKQIDPKIKTALIANMVSSASFSHLRYIDGVSVNYLFVNQSIVNMVHQNGKRVFVWTVDRPSDIQHMISLGVDNIITNRPDKAIEFIDSKSVGEMVLSVLDMVF